MLSEGSFACIRPEGGVLPYGLSLDNYRFATVMDLADLSQVYSSSFEVGNSQVPFHERDYSRDAASKIFEDLFRFYEHFGLDLKDNDNTNWPDSILMELDFMHYLSHLESIAVNEDDILALQRGQRDFLQRHLAPLVSGLAGKLSVLKITPYDQLSKLMNDFVTHEHAALSRKVDGLLAVAMVE